MDPNPAEALRRINRELAGPLPNDERTALENQRRAIIMRMRRARLQDEQNEMPPLMWNYDPDEKRAWSSNMRPR